MSNRLKVLLVILAFSMIAVTQQKPAAKTKTNSADQPGTHATANLPSEEDVNAFLHETFGYDSQLTWKIAGIRPSQAEGLAEVTVQISGPQGRGEQKCDSYLLQAGGDLRRRQVEVEFVGSHLGEPISRTRGG